jgi:hypothetical protein
MSENYIKIELPDDYEVPDRLVGLSPDEWADIFDRAAEPPQEPAQSGPDLVASPPISRPDGRRAKKPRPADIQIPGFTIRPPNHPGLRPVLIRPPELVKAEPGQDAGQADQANQANQADPAKPDPVDIIEKPSLLVCVIC